MTSTIDRREFIAAASAATALSALGGNGALAQESMPRRPIPSTGEMLPIVGLGSSKVVSEVSENGTEPVAAVLRALRARGGSVIDTWPRDAIDDAGLGRVLAEPDLTRQPLHHHQDRPAQARKPASISSGTPSRCTVARPWTWRKS